MSATREITPSASRLTSSLRDIGYDFESALADLIDNSIAAGASHISVDVHFEGARSKVVIVDDGSGMTARQLDEALRFGSRRDYSSRDLGKFGLGLKTASLSQARRLTVVSRAATDRRVINGLTLDLDHVERTDRWEVLVRSADELPPSFVEPLKTSTGTVVVWEGLDRILTYANPDGEWARRKLAQLTESARTYLAMVFHRFLAGEIAGIGALKLKLGGEVVQPWDPYVRNERATVSLDPRRYTLEVGGRTGTVTVRPFVLPSKEAFSSLSAFDEAAGPLKWNRQQGLYVYRAGRLIQAGGWSGLRTLDEHTKLARVAVEFEPLLDPLFQVNVAKMRVHLPSELRAQIAPQIGEVCHEADRVYREASAARRADADDSIDLRDRRDGSQLLLELRATALALGRQEFHTFERVVQALGRERDLL